ncbi:hypothetical protein PR202_ga10577 [Eleusine coracana subsp. coracana]|uniref:Protein GAMETE EXPRESSED 3 n=1 Tax=Eleusine coracana subsp. coracana TaxID=191504 RepID=A0AAV5C729_ELECO|nr:hypothetical protein PR202_ga10577 [Eleusine coracana subsp. coracana]
MASRTLWRICLLACFLMIHATRWVSPVALERKLYAAAAEKGQTTPPVAGRRRPSLSTPVIDHDSRLVACSGKDLLAFEPNGSAAWTVPLGHRCNQGIRPVTELGKCTSTSAVLFSYNATAGRSEQIIGFAVSGRYSSLFVTISNRGLFVLSLHGGLRWSLGPVLDRRGYPMGCKKNVSGCYFDSAPVVGHCEGALYVSSRSIIISNTEGQLYSLSIRSRQFRWIVDLSSLDKVMTIAPGNCGRLYILFARKSLIAGLDISTGNISWQQSIGPLSEEKSLPTVDSNDALMLTCSTDVTGWISIGSLDGNLYSISPDGDITKFLRETAQDSVIHASPVLDCSGFSMYVAQTIVEGKSSQKIGEYTYVSSMKKKPKRVLFNLLAPATGIIHWTGKYPGDYDNLLALMIFQFVSSHPYSEMQGSLHSKRRVLGKMISHLERRAIEDASSNETLERLDEMVKAKEGVERKLYKSYSLGRDRLGLKQDPSILPLYHGENKSHSFHSSQKESITIFNELSDTSTSEDGISSYSNDSGSCSCSTTSSGDMELDAIPRLAKEAGPSNNADVVDAMFARGKAQQDIHFAEVGGSLVP